ncbi:MAG: hypothetical protein ABSE59_03680 [Opitutaceae bacterium]|jgi:hypothetical protein
MNITLRKDAVLVAMNAVEFADVGAREGMIHRIYRTLCEDKAAAKKLNKAVHDNRVPIQFYSRSGGDVFVVRILCCCWESFRDVQATSQWEQDIQKAVVALGVSGQADRLTAQYSA